MKRAIEKAWPQAEGVGMDMVTGTVPVITQQQMQT